MCVCVLSIIHQWTKCSSRIFSHIFSNTAKKRTIFPFKTRNVEDLEPEDELLPACEPYYQQVHFGVRQSQVKKETKTKKN